MGTHLTSACHITKNIGAEPERKLTSWIANWLENSNQASSYAFNSSFVCKLFVCFFLNIPLSGIIRVCIALCDRPAYQPHDGLSPLQGNALGSMHDVALFPTLAFWLQLLIE